MCILILRLIAALTPTSMWGRRCATSFVEMRSAERESGVAEVTWHFPSCLEINVYLSLRLPGQQSRNHYPKSCDNHAHICMLGALNF